MGTQLSNTAFRRRLSREARCTVLSQANTRQGPSLSLLPHDSTIGHQKVPEQASIKWTSSRCPCGSLLTLSQPSTPCAGGSAIISPRLGSLVLLAWGPWACTWPATASKVGETTHLVPYPKTTAPSSKRRAGKSRKNKQASTL